MSDDIVERVARALHTHEWKGQPHPEEFRESRAYWIASAKVAIEAMRMPTKKMLNAACKSMSPDKRPTKNRVGVKAKHGIRYRAMIDAVLADQPRG